VEGIGIDFERSGRDLIEVLSRHVTRETEENY
jgi:hypothetical protein